MDALSCFDQSFIADEMPEQLPASSQVGKTRVGGIDLNKPRMRWVGKAVVALSPLPGGFTASELASQVRALGYLNQSDLRCPPRRLRSKEAPWQADRHSDRQDPPVRDGSRGAEGDHRLNRT